MDQMDERGPKTQTLTVAQTRERLSQLVTQVHRRETRVLVEESGVPVAAIVSAQDLEQLRRLDEQRQADFRAMAEIGQAFQGVPGDELEAEVAKALAAVRAENRAQQGQAPSP
jgi:prevent-host-death family protein